MRRPEPSSAARTGPEVSVVIPTCRRERLLVEAAGSALSQAGIDLEVVVVDDSADGSARAAVEGLQDARVRYLQRREPSIGRPAPVRNEGARAARGRLLHFLDDDDRLAPGALRGLADALNGKADAGLAFGIVEPFGEPSRLAHERAYFRAAARAARATRWRMRLVSRLLFENALLVSSACMVRAESFAAVGGFDPGLLVCEDTDFFLRVARRRGFVLLPRTVAHYRVGNPKLSCPEDEAAVFAEAYRAIHARYTAEHGRIEFNTLRIAARLGRALRAAAGREA